MPELDLDALAEPRPQGQWALAWRRLRRDRVAVACGVLLLVLVFAVGPGAPLYEKAVGHGPNDLFPYAVSVSLRPAGPLTVTWATPSLADCYKGFRAGAPDLRSAAGQWQFGLALLKESASL